MLLFCDSCAHYTTAQLADKYTSATAVTVVDGAGRLGSPALLFNASNHSALSKTLTPAALGAGGQRLTVGCAYRPLILTNTPNAAPILQIPLSNNQTISLLATAKGQLVVVIAPTGGILYTTLATSPLNTLSAGVGVYLELQVDLRTGATAFGKVTIRVNAATVVTSPIPALIATTYSSLILGGGPVGFVFAGRWYLSDLVVLDGDTSLPVGGILTRKGTRVTLGDFLGNIHVQALLPVRDGANLSVGNVPWVPALGSDNVANVNPPIATDNVSDSFNGGFPTGNNDTFGYRSPRAGSVVAQGLYGTTDGVAWPLYAVQWVARVKSNGGAPQVAPLIRRIVDGFFAGDIVAAGPTLTVTDVAYAFALVPLAADPTNSNKAWQLDAVALSTQPAAQPGDVELGIQKLVGIS